MAGSCPPNERQASSPSGHSSQDEDAKSTMKPTEFTISSEAEGDFVAEPEASEPQAR